MLKVGLCGGTGAGKTMVCSILREFGIPSVNTDMLARRVTEKDNRCLDELVERFGSDILLDDGSLDRKTLAKKAFATPEDASALNEITHPHIISLMNSELARYEKEGAKAVFVDAPMLFESGLWKQFDYNVAVVADTDIRIKRAMLRDSITAKQAKDRIRNQKSDRFLKENCDFYIENTGSEKELRENVLKVLEGLGIR